MCQGRSGWVLVPVSVLMLSLLAGCLGSGSSSNRSAQPAREHDDRIASGYYQLDVDSLQFAALDGFDDADRWWGELDGAGYRIEVPDTWNGTLVMYAHGYRGDEPDLTVDIPELRPHLLDRGYAWAASSYRANHYDVRSGVEDTNRLARYFREEFGSPDMMTYIIGQSMGGHVAAAAIEEETMEQANNGYSYDGVLALCGVMGDVELLSEFAA
ncbi:MAG: hypothetical protein LAT50_20345, partial [Ectothiorhodospiraceae bacterium]|nr:hypothetical protein [Ectothiorhodospiraceae bacterium]